MPTIVVEGPPIKDLQAKRELVQGISDVAAKVYGVPHITVLIRENPPQNVGVNGQLLVDRKQQDAKQSG